MPVCASDSDVFIAAAESALGMSLEVGEGDHRIVIQQMGTDRHLLEPLAAVDRKAHIAFLVHDVDGTECPAVYFQGPTVQGSGGTVAFVVGVGLYDRGVGYVLLEEGLDPFARYNIGAVLLAGVEFYAYFAGDASVYFLIGLRKALWRKVAGEIHYGFSAVALLVGDIFVSTLAGDRSLCRVPAGIIINQCGCCSHTGQSYKNQVHRLEIFIFHKYNEYFRDKEKSRNPFGFLLFQKL